jgi:predicted amidohydrolase
VRIAIAQLNPTVGDLTGNRKLVEEAAARAEAAGAEIAVFSEMILTGYPPMDLLERDGFVRDQLAELESLAPRSRGIDLVLGAAFPVEGGDSKRLVNAAVLLRRGERVAVQAKSLLPRRLRREALLRPGGPARGGRDARPGLAPRSHHLRGCLGGRDPLLGGSGG